MKASDQSAAGMEGLLSAIVDNDVGLVKCLLKGDRRLATETIRTERLYDSEVFHWIYVGDTALHLAAAGYRVTIVRALLAAGADAHVAKNRRGSSPLHYAADGFITGPAWDEGQQVETIRALVRGGAEIDLRDKNGATALHRAVRTRCAAAVRVLLESGADAGIENEGGSTAFHLAVQNTGRGGSGASVAVQAQREIVRAFLSAGVNPLFANSKGRSVADAARSAWILEMLEGD